MQQSFNIIPEINQQLFSIDKRVEMYRFSFVAVVPFRFSRRGDPFSASHGMRIVVAQEALVALIMQRKAIADAMRPVLVFCHSPCIHPYPEATFEDKDFAVH